MLAKCGGLTCISKECDGRYHVEKPREAQTFACEVPPLEPSKMHKLFFEHDQVIKS